VEEAYDWEGLVSVVYCNPQGRIFQRYVSKPMGGYFMIIYDLPDLVIFPSDVQYTPNSPELNSTATISASIHNESGIEAENVTVSFFDGDPANGGRKIGEVVVHEIAPWGSYTASVDWVPHVPGDRNIFIIADYNNSIPEATEVNNAVSIRLIIPAGNVTLLWEAPEAERGQIVIGDVDGDGEDEIVVGNEHRLFLYEMDGPLKWFLSIPVRTAYTNTQDLGRIVLGDIDADGSMEIVVASLDNKVYAIRPDGTILWVYDYGANIHSIAVAYRGENAKGQVIVGGISAEIRLLSSTGELIWASDEGANEWTCVDAGDLDGDGKDEIVAYLLSSDMSLIVAGQSVYSGYVYAFHADGTKLWMSENIGSGKLKVGDLDGDGLSEVIVHTNCSRIIYAFDGDGSILWESHVPIHANNRALSDLNGDTTLDVVTGGHDAVDHATYAVDGEDGHVMWKDACIIGDCRVLYAATATIGREASDVAVLTSHFHTSGGQRIGFGTVTIYNGEDGEILYRWEVEYPSSGTIAFARDTHGTPIVLVSIYGGLSAYALEGLPQAAPGKKQKIAWKKPAESLALSETRLLQNYPNPGNPEIWIPFQLAHEASVSISIYSVTGGLVRRIELGALSPGMYTNREKAAHWDGRTDEGEKVASGIYFCHLQAGSYSAVKKMLVLM